MGLRKRTSYHVSALEVFALKEITADEIEVEMT